MLLTSASREGYGEVVVDGRTSVRRRSSREEAVEKHATARW